jgi:glycosyltransferase involved in cell wall biosynthesis
MNNRSIAFLVNGNAHSAAAFRARAFAGYLSSEYDVATAYRGENKGAAVVQFLKFLVQKKPEITYVVDLAYSAVIAAVMYKLVFGNRLIIDTGDSVYALARSLGRGKAGLLLTWFLESFALRVADQIVVRGTTHKRQLFSKGISVEVIQDGVESALFRPMDVADLRRACGLENVITVGVLGSITWNRRLGMCYGSELVEAMYLLRDLPVKGVIIGDGSGLAMLKKRARELGVEDRVLFLGRIPYDELPHYLNLMDICLSTQTNDVVGQVRTTGKLPLYLASGRFVLASRVGEAALVLPDCMLVDYESTKDLQYAQRLAGKIRGVCREPQMLSGKISRSLAIEHFDYSVLSRRLSEVLITVTRPCVN